eukprot:PhM_4_TR16449/c0_g1_i1/m.1987
MVVGHTAQENLLRWLEGHYYQETNSSTSAQTRARQALDTIFNHSIRSWERYASALHFPVNIQLVCLTDGQRRQLAKAARSGASDSELLDFTRFILRRASRDDLEVVLRRCELLNVFERAMETVRGNFDPCEVAAHTIAVMFFSHGIVEWAAGDDDLTRSIIDNGLVMRQVNKKKREKQLMEEETHKKEEQAKKAKKAKRGESSSAISAAVAATVPLSSDTHAGARIVCRCGSEYSSSRGGMWILCRRCSKWSHKKCVEPRRMTHKELENYRCEDGQCLIRL